MGTADAKIELSHWLCGAGTPATAIRISSNAQLVAVGLGSGEVALHRLWAVKSQEPLRVITLKEWGYDSEVTGSVADLKWSPDSRALAVSFWPEGIHVFSWKHHTLFGSFADLCGPQGSRTM